MENSSKYLVVLTGKTASGKDSVMTRILSRFPDFKRVITTTSRKQRIGEENGVDYFFLSKAVFLRKIKKGDFIEYVSYGGNFYGTEKAQLMEPRKILVWRIDPSRAGIIRELIDSPSLVIYLTVDDSVVLERLKRRGFSKKDIEKRMKEDKKFWDKYRSNYDYVVENVPGKLDETVDKIVNLIENRLLHCS